MKMLPQSNWLQIVLLWALLLLLYYPLFYTDYLYTDEAVQLWLFRPGASFHMFTEQGRGISNWLFQRLFSKAHTIADVKYIRLFSLGAWALCLPLWFFIFRDITRRESLSHVIPFFACVYLICTPTFTLSVSWASCLELFLANTAALLSGYCVYRLLHASPIRTSSRFLNGTASLLFATLSLFTYQNGFGCFLLPFVLMFAAYPKRLRALAISVAVYLLLYLIYFGLFKWSLSLAGIPASNRTQVFIAPWGKLRFLFARPLNSAFHFTWLFNEADWSSLIYYGVVALLFIVATISRLRTFSKAHILRFLLLLGVLFALVYLPSLVVRENYASNRTLLALNMCVFCLVAITLFHFIKEQRRQQLLTAVLSLLFLLNVTYNFRFLFLNPVRNEFEELKAYLDTQYQPAISSVFFIRPGEDFFEKKYGINRSWDEFGVPSTFFEWTPGFLIKQIVYEKTGNRAQAETLQIKTVFAAAENQQPSPSNSVLVVNAPEILK